MPSRRGAGEKGLQSRGDPAKCLCWVGLGYTGCWRCWGLGAEPPGVRGWGGRQGLCTRQAGRMDEDVRGGEGSWARRQAQGQPVVEVVEAGIKPKNLIFSPEKKKTNTPGPLREAAEVPPRGAHGAGPAPCPAGDGHQPSPPLWLPASCCSLLCPRFGTAPGAPAWAPGSSSPTRLCRAVCEEELALPLSIKLTAIYIYLKITELSISPRASPPAPAASQRRCQHPEGPDVSPQFG